MTDQIRKLKAWLRGAVLLLVLAGGLLYASGQNTRPLRITEAENQPAGAALWDYQCADTVKFSRDTARQWAGRQTELEALIDRQLSAATDLGATCVSLGTPYDEEFVPFLRQWVDRARSKGLKVWFRGNFSGWEGWYDYPLFSSPDQHHRAIFTFVTGHPELFAPGDIFTPAPEPENGLVGNPFASRANRDGFLRFLSASFANCLAAFRQIGENVSCGFFSTNGSIAKDILTPEAVERAGGTIVIDHYVDSGRQMALDISYLYGKFSVPLVIGEFGAPIPDINGAMDEAGQAAFVKELLEVFYSHKDKVAGVNYWTLTGGTTAIFRDDGSGKPAAESVKTFFKPARVRGRVADGLGQGLPGARVGVLGSSYEAIAGPNGEFSLLVPAETKTLVFRADGYRPLEDEFVFSQGVTYDSSAELQPAHPSLEYRLKRLVRLAR